MFEVLVTSSVMILGILCLRKLTMGKIPMRVRYALWLLAAVRLLLPVSVAASPFSVMNLLPDSLQRMQGSGQATQAEQMEQAVQAWQGSFCETEQTESGAVEADLTDSSFAGESGNGREEMITAAGHDLTGKETAADGNSAYAPEGNGAEGNTAPIEEANKVLPDSGFSAYRIFLLLWMAGTLAVGGYLLIAQLRFARYLRQNRLEVSEDEIPESWKQRFHSRGIRVYQINGLPSPCLSGGHIYLGEQALSEPRSLSHVLAHEYCHALHLDGIWAFLRCFLAAVYWFDPFVWAAAFAVRQDSELACDEAAVSMLGETERFAYGRTLLAFLGDGKIGRRDRRKAYPGMSPMLENGEGGMQERILALTHGIGKERGAVSVLVLAVVFALCGCAFTGAAQGEESFGNEGAQMRTAQSGDGKAETGGVQVGSDSAEADGARSGNGSAEADGAQSGDSSADTDGVQNGNGSAEADSTSVQNLTGEEAAAAADQKAFEAVLGYHGVMEGKDDSELTLNRKIDYQAYYEYVLRGEGENPLVNGWYRLCVNEREGISLYGLYTEQFGFRGIKTLTMVGGDVNDFDIRWYPSMLNENRENIRVLDRESNGLARRFVWKLMAEESSDVEIWHLYSGFQYDTGTIELKRLTEAECLAWAKRYLAFSAEREANRVGVTYDGDMALGWLDISAYEGYEIESVQIAPYVLGFDLDSEAYGEEYRDGYEGIVVHLAPGLKLKGSDRIWIDGMHIIDVQAAEDGNGFRLQNPRIDEEFVARNKAQQDELGSPLVNAGDFHHDLRLTFLNPCPAYTRIADAYGERTHPATGEVRKHNGVDLAAPKGADILAAAAGTVYQTGFDAVNGNYVVLWHGASGQMTYYTHCSEVSVEKGDQVTAGERIAAVGQTGSATGACLHFAVSYGEAWEEPVWENMTDDI